MHTFDRPALVLGTILGAVLGAASGGSAFAQVVVHDFDGDFAAPPFAASATGDAVARRGAGPELADGRLDLLAPWWRFEAAVAFDAPAPTPVAWIEVAWTMVLETGTEGAGFAWLDASRHGATGPAPAGITWEGPNVAGSLGVGFDASNPVNRDPFRGSGNAYDRPQHEVSLHWDGTEIVKRTTPMDFRDGAPHRVRVRADWTAGGADVTVAIDDVAIVERFFVPSLLAYAGRPAFGARNAETAGTVALDDLRIAWGPAVPAPMPPLEIVAIDRALNDAGHPVHEATVEFPADTDRFARILCTLRLDQPETRFDPWDRIAHVHVVAEDGERYEILRYITPYNRGHAWTVDVTDFRPLLRGRARIVQSCTTYGEGWVVSVAFAFHPGTPERVAHRIVKLWSGAPEVGNPDNPAADFYVPRTVALAEETTAARVRLVVTGHGMAPNTDNAAEFMPLGRTLTVNGTAHRNVLWKTDNYLNPCRPQGGTWKYDRAGWAPGDVVRPWIVDATPALAPDRTLTIEYALDPYLNEARGQTWAPTHVTEGYLVEERPPAGGTAPR